MANQISESGKKSMKTRIITGTVMVLTLVPCVLFGNAPLLILGVLMAAIAAYELLTIPGKEKYSNLIKIVTITYAVLFVLAPYIVAWGYNVNPFHADLVKLTSQHLNVNALLFYLIPMALFVVYFLFMAMQVIIHQQVAFEDMTYLTSMVTYVCLGVITIMLLRNIPAASGYINSPNALVLGEFDKTTSTIVNNDNALLGATFVRGLKFYSPTWWSNYWQRFFKTFELLLVVILSTCMSDIGAYFFGVLWGKHPMNARISPHKTWEGFIGGCVFSYLSYFGGAALFEFALDAPLLPGVLQYSISNSGFMGGHCWILLVIIGLIIPFVGNIGGFMFSAIKRHFGVKDFGKIFPGHGGIIDRFDSSLTNSIAIVTIILIATSFYF